MAKWLAYLFVYIFMQGIPFAKICELIDVSDSLIVRTIVRLDEICWSKKNVASIIGNSTLPKKMKSTSNLIRRKN